jgi:hypothetical protein
MSATVVSKEMRVAVITPVNVGFVACPDVSYEVSVNVPE